MAERVGGYEARDVPVRRLLKIVVPLGILVLVLHVLLVLLGVLFDRLAEQPPGPVLEQVELVPPPPRLQPQPEVELEEVLNRQQELLHGYGWVDRDAGIARLPIERAMVILAERGWPNPVEGPVAWPAPPVPVGTAGEPPTGQEQQP